MTVTIDLSPEEVRRLEERAARVGQDLTTYLRRLVREDLKATSPAGERALDEILAPVRDDFCNSGLSEDGLENLVEEVREDRWRATHGRPSK